MNPQHHNPPPYPSSRPTSLLLPPSTSSTQQYYPSPSPFPNILTPTATTPMVMTPNTIKSIEQSILQTLGEDGEESYMMESQAYSGNFVPPLPSSTSTITLINTWQGGQVSSDMDTKEETDKPTPEPPVKKQKKPVTPRKKQVKAPPPKKSPKKPTRPQKPPPSEEDERRRVRRERNKLAAARCRKRRVDHTNKLLQETEGLEDKKRNLQTQITELQNLKEELEFILEAHNCVKKLVKNEVLSDLQNLPSRSSDHKLKRPNTLNVMTNERIPVTVSTPAPPIPINTPSTGIAGLGFEPLCSDWGVNTPTPCSEGGEEKGKGGSLVTPSNPFKKLQDL